MEKNQKSTETQHKSGTAGQGDKMKDSAKHDPTSKKMMNEKTDEKPSKDVHSTSHKDGKGK